MPGNFEAKTFVPCQEMPMNRLPHDQRPLFDPWFAWRELPDAVRQHALDVLTALYIETIVFADLDSENDDSTTLES
jgi:hypothetical protein